MIFSKAKMIARVTAEGRAYMINEDVERLMDLCDGQPVSPACWNRVVNDYPVYSCLGKDGKYHDVNEHDCIEE